MVWFWWPYDVISLALSNQPLAPQANPFSTQAAGARSLNICTLTVQDTYKSLNSFPSDTPRPIASSSIFPQAWFHPAVFNRGKRLLLHIDLVAEHNLGNCRLRANLPNPFAKPLAYIFWHP